MAYYEKHLVTKKSILPNAGKGLYTRVDIPKGARIVEYKGRILTWKEVQKMPDERNGYVFYVNSKHVIDAWDYKTAIAKFANDARGLTQVEGLRNNAEYIVHKKRCYIAATRNIKAGDEIFVEYGAEYWQVIRYNHRIELQNRAKEGVKSKKVELPHQLAAKKLV